MLPQESKFDGIFMVFNEMIFLSGAVLGAPLVGLSLKSPVLVGLITKRSIESVTVKTRLAVKN